MCVREKGLRCVKFDSGVACTQLGGVSSSTLRRLTLRSCAPLKLLRAKFRDTAWKQLRGNFAAKQKILQFPNAF